MDDIVRRTLAHDEKKDWEGKVSFFNSVFFHFNQNLFNQIKQIKKFFQISHLHLLVLLLRSNGTATSGFYDEVKLSIFIFFPFFKNFILKRKVSSLLNLRTRKFSVKGSFYFISLTHHFPHKF